MNVRQQYLNQSPLDIAQSLADQFALSAAERDKQGGNPKQQRDLIRDSGLLGLSIPKQYGGQGADWQTIFQTIQAIARVDSSLAHVYGFHHLLLRRYSCSHSRNNMAYGLNRLHVKTYSGAIP